MRRLLLVAFGAVALVAAFLLLRGGGDGGADECVIPALFGETRPATPAPAAPAGVGEVAQERRAVDASADGAPLDGGWLRVVDLETRAAVAGATVHAAVDSEIVNPVGRWWLGRDPRPEIVAAGREFSTGEDGRVRLPGLGGRVYVVAEAGSRRGFVTLDEASPPEVQVGISEVVTLRAIVVDGAGNPRPDVPVRLMDWIDLGFSGAWIVRFEAAANDGSYVRIPLAVRTSEVLPLVRPAVVGLSGSDVSVDPTAPPAEPIRLVVPQTGRVRVDVFDEAGAPWVKPLDVTVQWGVSHSPDHARASVEGGAAVFSHVVVGAPLTLTARSGEARGAVFDAGPRPVGREHVVRLTVAEPEALRLVGRLLDVDGDPLANARCQLDDAPWHGFVTTTGPGWPPVFTTDDEGRFDEPFHRPGGWSRRPRRVEAAGASAVPPLEVRPLRGDGRPDSSRRAEVPLPPVLGPGHHDVGELRLVEDPLFVAGVVERPDGTPIEGADVRVIVKRPVLPGSVRGRFGARFDPRRARLRTGADGRFAVHARLDDVEGEVSASLAGVGGDDVPFRRGANDLRLVIVPVGGVAGRVVLDDGVPADRLVFAFHRGGTRRPVTSGPDGSFRATGLREGTWSFVVGVPGEEPSVARVEEIVVEGDETAHDPRLEPLDLRGRVVVHVVDVVDAAGRPIPGAAVTRPDLGRVVGHTDARGRLSVVSTRPAVEVSVYAENERRVERRVVAGAARIVVE